MNLINWLIEKWHRWVDGKSVYPVCTYQTCMFIYHLAQLDIFKLLQVLIARLLHIFSRLNCITIINQLTKIYDD